LVSFYKTGMETTQLKYRTKEKQLPLNYEHVAKKKEIKIPKAKINLDMVSDEEYETYK
jgi:hypothetical protein